MEVLFVDSIHKDSKLMFVRLVEGVYLTKEGAVQEVSPGTEPPYYMEVAAAVYEALERAILMHAGLAEELRSRLFDTMEQRDQMWDMLKLDNETFRERFRAS